MLEVLYQDQHLVAINKPHDLLVHRSSIAKDVSLFALQLLRDQLQKHIYTVHRLDRKTSGVLLFSFTDDVHRSMQKLFAENKIKKTYWAIVRGFTEDEGTIDYPLKRDDGKTQEAITHYKTLARTEVAIPFGKFSTSRYSWVEIYPSTGRMHQIRKHFAHILHPIIADRPHGCNKQNKLFKDRFEMKTMLLHAKSIEFSHPVSNRKIFIEAEISDEFLRMIKVLNFTFP